MESGPYVKIHWVYRKIWYHTHISLVAFLIIVFSLSIHASIVRPVIIILPAGLKNTIMLPFSGGPRGQGQSKQVVQNRRRKAEHKSTQARRGADRKARGGMF